MSNELLRRRLLVRGRVQGVSFRAYTQAHALRLGISGWVRNLADGSVELEAQGSAALLDRLALACREGPPAARVDSLEVEPLEVLDGDAGFQLRRST